MGTQWRRLHQHWQQNTLTGRLHQQWQQNTLTGRKTGYASFCTKVREFLKSWITNRDKKKLYWHEFVETWKENQTEIGYIVLLGSIIGCPPLLAVWSICRTERACWSWRVWAKQLDSLHENVFIEHNWTFCKLELSGLYRFCGSGGGSVGVVTRLSAGLFAIRFPEANKLCGLQYVQTSSGAILALFHRNRRYFSGDKAVEDWSWRRSSV